MIRSLWIAKTGMDAEQFNLDVISNNLANSQTTAFKRIQTMFQDLLYTTIRAAGSSSNAQNLLPTGMQVGAGAAVTGTERNNIQGTLFQTGNKLDVAIKGNGFFIKLIHAVKSNGLINNFLSILFSAAST